MPFELNNQQYAAFRQKRIAGGLVKSLNEVKGLSSEVDENSGKVIATTDAGGVTKFGFDEHGFIGHQETPMGRKFRLRNNHKGKLEAFATPSGSRTDLQYDSDGRVIATYHQKKKVCDFSYGDSQQIERYSYPDKTQTELTFHTPNHVASVTNRLGHTDKYGYSKTNDLNRMVDGRGNETRFSYGDWARPDAIKFADGSTEGYQYDDRGQLSKLLSNDKLIADVSIDDAGRLDEVIYADGTFRKFTYDEAGQILVAENEHSTVKFHYNGEGKIVCEEQGDAKIEYAYDTSGLLESLTYPDGKTVKFGHDLDTRVSEITGVKEQKSSIRYLENDAGYEIDLPNDLSQECLLTERGLLRSSRVTRKSNSAEIYALQLGYDAEDRVVSKTDSQYGDQSFEYDAESQVLKVSGVPEAEQFSYDEAGNRISVDGLTCEYDAVNQIRCHGGQKIEHDAQGNALNVPTAAGMVNLKYNLQNQVVASSSPVANAEYGYDAMGRRIWKKSNGVVTRFFYAADKLIHEVVEAAGEVKTKSTAYVLGGHSPFMTWDELGNTCYFHNDHLGTPQRLTDDFGRTVWSASYKAFGEAKVEATYDNALRMPGQYFDQETGLHYNGARYYSPILGRFLSRDPAKFLTGTNFYTYVGNDPINSADPSGLWPSWESVFKVVKVVAVVAASVAVAAVVIAAAPVALAAIGITGAVATGIAIVASGAAAGAVAMGLNEALNQEKFCLGCIFSEALRGAGIGAVASLPFVFLPLTAGVAAFAGVGGASGALGYLGDVVTSDTPFSWKGLALATGIGAGTAGLGRYLGPRISGWFKAPKSVANRNLTKAEWKAISRQARIDAKGGLPRTYREFQAFTRGRYTGAGHQAARGRAWAGYRQMHGITTPNSSTGSYAWSNVRRRLGQSGWADAGQDVHHWLIPRNTWGRVVPDAIKNRKWNLMRMPSRSEHFRVHGWSFDGQPGYNLPTRLWRGTPTPAKLTIGGAAVAGGTGYYYWEDE